MRPLAQLQILWVDYSPCPCGLITADWGLQTAKLAVKIFKYNLELYPKSYNAHDSLAEAYLFLGDKENEKKCNEQF